MMVRKVRSGDDIDAVCDIYCQSWRAAFRGSVPQDYLDALSGSRWRPALENSELDSYVVMDGDIYMREHLLFVRPETRKCRAGERL